MNAIEFYKSELGEAFEHFPKGFSKDEIIELADKYARSSQPPVSKGAKELSAEEFLLSNMEPYDCYIKDGVICFEREDFTKFLEAFANQAPDKEAEESQTFYCTESEGGKERCVVQCPFCESV